MRTPSIGGWVFACVAIGLAVYAQAAGVTDLTLFKAGGLAKGRWGIEVLETDRPEMQKAMGGKMSICADLAEQIRKNAEKDSSCTPKILTNTASLAEVETTCSDGSRTHAKINKEADKTYLMDLNFTSSDGEKTHSKLRYAYQGECKADDAMIQLDKNSEACKMMSSVDVSRCQSAPESMRAQCEQQLKQMAKMCQ